MGRRNNKISKPRKDTFAIVVDGKTEVWYFQMLKRNESNLQVNIEPKIPQKKKLSEQYKKIIELAEDYTKVFWIIDLDVVIAESKVTKKGETNQIQKLTDYLDIIEKKYKNVISILNNPCLEYWFILHFNQNTRYFPQCKEAEKELKKYLKDYEKTRKYFTKHDNDIYLRLKPKLTTALKNAKKTKRRSFEEIERAICEMNLFFKSDKIKKAIDIKENLTVNNLGQ